MEDAFRVRPLTEADINAVIELAGGRRAHANTDRRTKRSADYRLAEAIIELKTLEDEGFEKPQRQAKLAALFREGGQARPVIVLDPGTLTETGNKTYQQIVEGPIKTAIRSARPQLMQSRKEHPEATTSILLVINNGYTTLNHDELLQLVVRRARNHASEIDGVVVAGCYYYSDTFDSYFLWPMDYVPINEPRTFVSYESLHHAWGDFAEKFMTKVVRGEVTPSPLRGPVVDTQFTLDGITYVKPVPPMGSESKFFAQGRPRKDSSGLTHCPPVATTFPDLTVGEWRRLRKVSPHDPLIFSSYKRWRAERRLAADSQEATKPFVPVPVTFAGWKRWCKESPAASEDASIARYANDLFEKQVRTLLAAARDRSGASILPTRYVMAVTEIIGQDRANDVSHILVVSEAVGERATARLLAKDLRIFHEYAVALAAAYAVAEAVGCVMWEKDLRYAWT